MAERTLTEGSVYIFNRFSMLGIKIWLKLTLSGHSVIVPSEIIAAYRFLQSVDEILVDTNSTTGGRH